MENTPQPKTIAEVQSHIDELNAEILLKQMEIHRYEAIGHTLIAAMMEEL